MAPFSFIILSLVCFPLIALSQQLAIVTPSNSSVIQCANLAIQWSGGVSPFFLTMGTPDNANVTDFEAVQSVDQSPYIWNVDMPAGLIISLSVQDANGISSQTPLLAVQNSTNSSCLSGDISSPLPPDTSSSAIISSNPIPSTSTDAGTFTATPSGSPPSRNLTSHTAAIVAGVVAGILVLVAFTITLILLRNRRRRRTTSRENLLRTFGSTKASLDGPEDEEEAMGSVVTPEPYIIRPRSRENSTLISREDLRRTQTPSQSSLASVKASQTPTTILASRKGELYLPDITSSGAPLSQNSGNVTNDGAGPSRLEVDDLDRLAARMVAMMASGRTSDQHLMHESLSLSGKTASEAGFPAPPPLYKDVVKRPESRPGGRTQW